MSPSKALLMQITPFVFVTAIAVAGFLIGVIFGRLTWGRLEPSAQAAALEPSPDTSNLERELAAARAQLRPLGEEVDRLKRELVRARKGEAAALPAPDTAAPDIRQLKGVGDKFAQALGAIGLGSIAALAALDDGGVESTDVAIGVFNGRVKRDRLVEQAQLLQGGRVAEYEAKFGKLGGAR